jgi:lipid A 3-O-deacylase
MAANEPSLRVPPPSGWVDRGSRPRTRPIFHSHETAGGGSLRSNRPLLPLLIGLLLVALSAARAAAQDVTYEVVFENDALIGAVPGVVDSDREYTHGLVLAAEQDGAHLWNALAPGIRACVDRSAGGGVCARTRFETGQKIFTPDFRKPWLTQLQRPYAGWLFGAMTARILDDAVSRSVRAELGITGPQAMGELFQRLVHKLLNSTVAEWDQQLGFEPAVLLQYREDRLLELGSTGSTGFDLLPAWQVSVGNLRTGMQVGLTGRVGRNLPHPWLHTPSDSGWLAFGFVAARQGWTLHELFLDGNLFQESSSVERRPFAAEAEIGGAVEYRKARLTSSLVFEQKLYETQPRAHRYARVVLTYTP